MRPLRLQIENFSAFKGKQPALDLAAFDLLAIAGPTGSGKSSLLDAMVFALYGKVPRLGKGVTEMISLGRDRMSAVLDFRSGERAYRVSRVARRGRSGEAQLEELTNGDERPIADGVKRVDEEIQGLLGLGYEAFTQAVILPQGEFAKFLKSQAAERQKILRDLLRLQVFDRMRKRATEEVARLKATIEARDAILSKEYAASTPEALSELSSRLAACTATNESLRAEVPPREQALAGLRLRQGKTSELGERRRRLAALEARDQEQAGLAARLDTAERAARVIPDIESTQRASEVLEAEVARCEATAERLRQATEDEAQALEALQRARDAAAEVPRLAERIRALDEVSGLIQPRDQARGHWERAKRERAAKQAELDRAASDQARDLEALAATETALQAAARSLEALDYDAERHRRLEALSEAGLALTARRAEAARLQQAHSEAALRLAAGRVQEEETQAERRTAEAQSQRAEQRLAAAQEALLQARNQHAAAHLRSALRKGESCPVCDQRVARLPGAVTVPMLEEIEGRRQAAQGESVQAAQVLARATEAVARTEQTQAHHRGRWEQLEQEWTGLKQDVTAGEAALAVVAHDLDPGEAPPEARLRASLSRLAGMRDAHAQALRERDRLAAQREVARERARHREQTLHTLEEAVRRLDARLAEAEAAWRSLEERVEAVTEGGDPQAERERLVRLRRDLESACQEAEQAERTAALGLHTARVEWAQAERVRQAAERTLQAALAALSAALSEAGFESGEEARAGARSDAEREEWRNRLEQHRRDRHALELRVAELVKELGGAEVGDDALSAAERDLADLRRRTEEGMREETRLQHEIADLTRRAERAVALAQELHAAQGSHSVYRQLADDLGSDRFQAYLLEEAFAELVQGASKRLLEVSGRYTLEFSDSAFHVLDHDNARERRSAETLSGGETFLASLALALELSQQVQRAAGAVHLDSLFIDEGFGTLDPETLETVADALFGLPVGGRLVGIITHIPELTDRLPARLRVEKRPDGSEVRVELG